MKLQTTITRANDRGRPRLLPALASIAVLAACGDSEWEQTGGDVGTLAGPDVMLRALTEEVYAVGSVDGDDWDTFGDVRSVHFDDQSNLHILDAQADQVLVVGLDGALVRTVGGPGDGPGELGGVLGMFVGRDGSYTTTGFTEINLFAPGGEFVRRIARNPGTMGIATPGWDLPDGRLVTTQVLYLGNEMVEEGTGPGRPIFVFFPDSAPVLHYTAWELPGEDEDNIDMSEDEESDMTISFAAGRSFEPGLEIDVLSDGRLAVIDSIGYRVKLVDLDGSVSGIIERPIAPVPVDDAVMEAERERYRQNEEESVESGARFGIRVEREGVDALTFAEEIPVLWDLSVDWNDRIWLERRSPTTGRDGGPIDIVTSAGDYVGTLPPDGLRTPEAFGPDGLMAFVEYDDLDVATVRVVRLVALEPAG